MVLVQDIEERNSIEASIFNVNFRKFLRRPTMIFC
jgi:hypothetical protein